MNRCVTGLVWSAGLLLVGCGAPTPPPASLAMNKATACVRQDGGSLMVVDWPTADLAVIDAVARRAGSLMVLRYDGCRYEVLRECVVPGQYSSQRTPPIHTAEVLRNRSDVEAKAKLVFWAPELEAHFARNEELVFDTTVRGDVLANRQTVFTRDVQGPPAVCTQATHVVAALQYGGWFIASNAQRSAGGSATAPVSAMPGSTVAASGSNTSQAMSLREACVRGECEAPLRIEVRRIVNLDPAAPMGPAAGGVPVVPVSTSFGNCPSGSTWDYSINRCAVPWQERRFRLHLGTVSGGTCRIGFGCRYRVKLVKNGQAFETFDAKGFEKTYDFQRVTAPMSAPELGTGLDLTLVHAGEILNDEKFLGNCRIEFPATDLQTVSEGARLERSLQCGDGRTINYAWIRDH